jgi:hypothetical protein
MHTEFWLENLLETVTWKDNIKMNEREIGYDD